MSVFVLFTITKVQILTPEWANEDMVALVEATQFIDARMSWNVDVIELSQISGDLYGKQFSAWKQPIKRWYDVSEIRPARVLEYDAEQDALPRSHARTATGPGHLGNQSMSLSLLRGTSRASELLRDVEQTADTDMLREDTDKVPECNSVLMTPPLDTTSQKRAVKTTEKSDARAWRADNLRKKELGENHTLTGELSKRIENQQGIKIIPLEKTFGPELRDFHDTLHLEINTLQPGVKTLLYTLDGSEPNLHRFDGSG